MGSCESTERSGPNGDNLLNAAEIEEKRKKEMIEAAKVAGALLAAGVIAWGVSSLFSSESSGKRKVMKAPGRNGYIYRDEFEIEMGSCESTERSRPNGDGMLTAAEIEEKRNKLEMIEAAKVAGGLVAAGVIAWGVSSLFFSGSSGNRKMMKAPGRNGYIYVDEFESDPARYFRSLRD
ncbi:hypothetical protein ACET3Z_030145 [Daucus carota]